MSNIYELWESGNIKSILIPNSQGRLLLQNFLGRGSSGLVFSAHHTGINNVVAVKQFPVDKDGDNDEFLTEILSYEYLSKFPECSNYIICFYDSFVYTISENRKIGVLITELMGYDLFDKPISKDEILSYIHYCEVYNLYIKKD